MKIGDIYTRPIGSGIRIRRRGAAGAVSISPGVGAVDHVELSDRGREVQRARILALEAPDVREGLVAEIQREIEQGSYGAPAAAVLDKMVHDHAEMRL